MRSLGRLHRNETAQVLPMFIMLMLVICAMVGLATDLGRIYVARAQLGRSVDAAALAGAKQLPNITQADAKARAFISQNEPDTTINVNVYPDVPSQQVEVSATKTVHTVFMRLVGIDSVQVNNHATAGFGVVPVDAVMAIDATGSMGASPCNASHNNSGCPIWEAKNAAKAFTNTLLPGSNTSVGIMSFRGCFKPAGTNSGCVLTSSFGALTGTAANVITKINAMDALGGTGTNVCGGLDGAASVLLPPATGSHTASNTVRVIVILSDGDNTYNNASYVAGGSPVAACMPANPSSSDAFVGTGCSAPSSGTASGSNPGSNSETHERDLDTRTKARADALKTQGVEIYVVGFGVCGTEDNAIPGSSYCSSSNIGNSSPDTVADQRLLKCIASSSAGTNDHYFRANTATDLPGIFSTIAQTIAFRLIK